MSERRLLFAMSRVAPSTHCSEPKRERMCGLLESAVCPTKDDDIGFFIMKCERLDREEKED